MRLVWIFKVVSYFRCLEDNAFKRINQNIFFKNQKVSRKVGKFQENVANLYNKERFLFSVCLSVCPNTRHASISQPISNLSISMTQEL